MVPVKEKDWEITFYPMFVRWRSKLQAVRCFEDNDIVHVNGKIDPKTGIDLINLELYFSDLDQIVQRIQDLNQEVNI